MSNTSLRTYVLLLTLLLSYTNARAQSALGVYDATNKFVGNLISKDLVGTILNGVVTALPFDADGLQEGNGVVFFVTDDCRGSGYLSNQTVPPAGYYAGDNTVYYARQPPEKVTGSFLLVRRQLLCAQSDEHICWPCQNGDNSAF